MLSVKNVIDIADLSVDDISLEGKNNIKPVL
jgi:hypothetical protein